MKHFASAVLLAVVSVAAPAMEVAGVQIADVQQAGGTTLVLNGAGLRKEYAFVSVYVAALYLPQKADDADKIIEAKTSRRILMVMKRDVGAEQMLKAFHKGIAANLPETELQAVQPKLDELDRVMRAINEVKQGDVLAIDMDANGGVGIALNGQPKASIAGPELAPALLKIWLGPHPVQDDLKQALLGR